MMDRAYSTHGVKNYTHVFLEHQKGPEHLPDLL